MKRYPRYPNKFRPQFNFGFDEFFNGRLTNPFYRGSYYAKEFEAGQNAAYFANLRNA